jgi:hypothetical protein
MNWLGMDSQRRRWPVIPAPFGLPIGFALLLCVGAAASVLNGRLGMLGVAAALAAPSSSASPS